MSKNWYIENKVEEIISHYSKGNEKIIIEPVLLQVDSEDFSVELNGSVFILLNETLPLGKTDRISIVSPTNILATTKSEYDGFVLYKHQVFEQRIEIRTQTGNFTPFVLEFLKIKPTKNGK